MIMTTKSKITSEMIASESGIEINAAMIKEVVKVYDNFYLDPHCDLDIRELVARIYLAMAHAIPKEDLGERGDLSWHERGL